MPDPGGACRNCGAELHGRYCHRCGQEVVEHRLPLRVLVADALGDLLAFDSRILRTLRPLFLRPGHLTAEWVRGRRMAYVPPLRLYVFVAAVFFLVLAVTDVSLVTLETGEASGETAAAPAGASGRDRWERAFAERLEAAAADPEGLEDRFVDRLGSLSLLLPPALAALLAVAYRRRRRFFVEHMVFSLHFHAFVFLSTAAVAFLPPAIREAGADLALTALVGVYLFLALRRVYGGRRWAAALRVAAVALSYLLLGFLPTLLLAFVWTIATS